MSKNVVERFLLASIEERFRMALDESNADNLQSYFGQAAYNEYLVIAKKTLSKLDEQHLGVTSSPNLIFIPGVMGSLLQSSRFGGMWWIDIRTRNHIDHLKLAPNGQEAANSKYEVIPCSTDPSYEPFLAAVLERDDFEHILFPYDWRKSLNLSTNLLRDKVLEVYANNGNQPIHFVAHSMGGLLVRATLMAHGQELWPKLGRIVFIGTPHYGSPAIASYLKNHLWGFDLMGLLGRYLSRDTYRSLWGVLSMLPAPKSIYPGTRNSDDSDDPYLHPCTNFDMYQVDNWKLDLTDEQKFQLQDVLNGAFDFHQQMYQAHRTLDQYFRDQMAVIAGVGFKTLFRLAYDKHFFGLWERMTKVTERIPADLHRDGDGSVPLASAALEDVGEIRYVKGMHNGLTNISEVYEDIFRWLNGENMRLPDTPDGALSQHLSVELGESEAPNLDGTIRNNAFTDAPGFWQVEQLSSQQLDELEAKLDAGQLPDFIRVRLL